jgi:fructokinase
VLTIIGEALVDLVDSGDLETFTAHPGGSPLNVAVGLARLDHDACMMARLSGDTFGRVLRRHAERNRVDLRASAAATEPTTLAVVSLDEEGRASYDFYLDATADWQWSAEELARLPDQTTILHTGSLASWTPPGGDLIAALVRRVRAAGEIIISYDPNVRPRLLGAPERGQALVERNVAAAHVVKASDEDLRWLYPDKWPATVAADWLKLGAAVVVVTQGAQGATAYTDHTRPVQRAAPVITLVDTVGAGDAFTSGLLSALDDMHLDASGLVALGETDLAEIVDHAILVSALTCERAGADPPSRAQVAGARSRLVGRPRPTATGPTPRVNPPGS